MNSRILRFLAVVAGIAAACVLVFARGGPAANDARDHAQNNPATNPPARSEPAGDPKQTTPTPQPAASFPPGYNFALAENGATAEGGRYPERLIDGRLDYTAGSGFAISYWGKAQPFVVKFKAPAEISCIRFLLWDLSEQRFYRYKLEVNPGDETNGWRSVADKTGGDQECRSWQDLSFAPQTVKQIRLTGTYNNVNSGFQVVELQAFRDPPPLEKRPPPVMQKEPTRDLSEPEF